MLKLLPIFCIITVLCYSTAVAQKVDSTLATLENLQQIPLKYINAIHSKIDLYSNRVFNKTEKTLTKLSKWENKIHQLLLEVNPAAALKLFGNDQLTFTTLLQKVKEGENITLEYRNQYDQLAILQAWRGRATAMM